MTSDSVSTTPCKVLVGFVHIGETTVERVRESISAQRDVDLEVFEIAGLPQVEAHRQLYAGFDLRSTDVDLMVKVDGDTELLEPRLFRVMVDFLALHPDVDLLSVGVDDWFSQERIHGLAAWRGGVRWLEEPDGLFPDLVRTTERASFKILDCGRPLVLHGEEPTLSQAARYGAHRGLKSAATRKPQRIERTIRFAERAAEAPHPARLVALAAVDVALTRPERAMAWTSGEIASEDLADLAARGQDPALAARVIELLRRRAPHVPRPSLQLRIRRQLSALKHRSSPPPLDPRAAKTRDFLALLDERHDEAHDE